MTQEERYFRTILQDIENVKDKMREFENEIKQIKGQIKDKNGSERQSNRVKK